MKSYGSYGDVAFSAWRRHLASHPLTHYAGILSMHGLGRLAKMQNAPELLEELKTTLEPFWQGRIEKAGGVYGPNVYRWGGNATAFLFHRELLPEAKQVLIDCCEKLLHEQERDSRGIYHMPSGNRNDHSEGFIWIDTVFGVCPFLLWTGLAVGRQDFIDEACAQMIKHHEVLFDKSCKLYYQAVNFNKPGAFTPAHWSRGCGWGAFALAEMIYDLPKDHKDYPAILTMYRELMEGCRDHMDENGMLHQAMETPQTYVETSGTGLVLYAMSRGIKNGSLSESEFMEPFLRGIKGMSRYIALDGSVFNTCMGCLAPGDGTAVDYEKRGWAMNDEHSFGPVILLFGQAQQLHKMGKILALPELLA